MSTSEFLLSLLFVGAIMVLGWSRLSRGFGPQKPLEPVARPFMAQREQAMRRILHPCPAPPAGATRGRVR